MTLPALLWAHRHISEREVAHNWPDGQHDNASWEDCTWCSSLMLARVAHDAKIPATHVEAEHLRDDAGQRPTGGSSADDAERGLRDRYQWSPQKGFGFSSLWATLRPGKAAMVQGSMGAFAAGSPMRRFDPPFHGAHAVFVARLDATDRVWWDDPLAPSGTSYPGPAYSGQWVTKEQLRGFVNAIAGSWLLGTIRARPAPPSPPLPAGRIRVSGAWFDYRVSGTAATGYDVTRTQRFTNGFSAAYGTVVEAEYGGKVRRLGHLTDGIYRGRWIDLDDETLL